MKKETEKHDKKIKTTERKAMEEQEAGRKEDKRAKQRHKGGENKG